jgi:hypothetical protein
MSDEPKKTRWQVFVATVPAIFVTYAIIGVLGPNAPPSLLLFVMLPAAAVTWLVCLRILDRRWR